MIPKTFSAPADETYPALNGYVPSPEDSLRYAVWLMLMADDVNRRAYSYDPEDESKGVRISQGRPDYDAQTLAIDLPCQIVDVSATAVEWKYSTSHAGELELTAGIALIEKPSSAKVLGDATAPDLTVHMKLDRVRRILMRGTLWREDINTQNGKLIDPYRTPLLDDGSYDMDAAVWLSVKAPDIRPARRQTFPNKRVRTDADLAALDPIRDFAVSYGWLAKYTVSVSDRDTMR
jgi:hypothetical protein